MCAYNITEPPHREDWQIAIYPLDLYFLIAFPNSILPSMCIYSTTDVARCRDGEHVSRVSLHDAGECQPGLLSMEWYPFLFLKFFHQLIFSMQAHVFFGDTWHHPYISTCFCGKRFYFPYNGKVALLLNRCKNRRKTPSMRKGDCTVSRANLASALSCRTRRRLFCFSSSSFSSSPSAVTHERHGV